MRKKIVLSIVIPVYNEESTLREIIKRVEKLKISNRITKEIIIVDDGSNDGTTKILAGFKHKNLKIIFHKQNRGKGAAMRTGFRQCSGDIVVVQDADLEYNPEEIGILIDPIINGVADVVFGSRFITNKPHRVLYFWHSIGNSLLTLFSNVLTNLNLTDMETGYKAFRGNVVKKITPNLESDRFGFEPEITARVAKLAKKEGRKIYEVGISYSGRTYKEGKKITWKDGFAAFWYIFKYNILK